MEPKGVPGDLDEKSILGVDFIELEAGAKFPLHVHPGAHIVFVLEGKGELTIGKNVHNTDAGDSIYVPGSIEHRVAAIEKHKIIVIAVPHQALDNADRMDITDEKFLEENPEYKEMYSGSDMAERAKKLKKYQDS